MSSTKISESDEPTNQAVQQASSDIQWPLTNENPVLIDKFGKDHWSTFAYLETRIVDYKGLLDHNHMRCDETRHPILAAAASHGLSIGLTSGSKYPSFIKGEFIDNKWTVDKKDHHDDYDCLCDLINQGLVNVEMPSVASVEAEVATYNNQPLVTGLVEQQMATKAKFSLTKKGRKVANQLREWKSEPKNNFHSFVVSENLIVDSINNEAEH